MARETYNGLNTSLENNFSPPSSTTKDFIILADPDNAELAIKVGKEMKHTVWPGSLDPYSDAELYPKLPVSVRDKKVYVIGSPSEPDLHSKIWKFGMMCKTAYDSDAKEVTAVMPYLPYQRSDKKDEPRITIGGKFMVDFLEKSRVNRLATVDLHNAALQSAANDMRWITLFSSFSIIPELLSLDLDDVVVSSPDAGRLKVAKWFRNYLHTQSRFNVNPDVPAADKYRELYAGDKTDSTLAEADYRGKDIIIVDDILSSGGTMTKPAADFKKYGARSVVGVVTHALWTGNAIENIRNSCFDMLLVTDSVPQPKRALDLPNVREVTIAPLLAGAINCIENGIPVSDMFLKASYQYKDIPPLYTPQSL